MTHSTRRSYKDKYLAAKANIPDVTSNVQGLTHAASFLQEAEFERNKQHELVKELAKAVSDLVGLLDSKEGQLGYDLKDMAKPIDRILPSLDATLVIRRARDVVIRATDRIGMASCGLAELRQNVSDLNMGASLLTNQLVRNQHGYLESFTIGSNPTDKEVEEASAHTGMNPRTLGYAYETDNDDSDIEESDEEEQEKSVVIRSPRPVPNKPVPAHKKIDSKNSNISIS